jgi:hypothetical protein
MDWYDIIYVFSLERTDMALDKQSNPISSTKLSLLSERTYNSAEEIVSNLFREIHRKLKRWATWIPLNYQRRGVIVVNAGVSEGETFLFLIRHPPCYSWSCRHNISRSRFIMVIYIIINDGHHAYSTLSNSRVSVGTRM